MTQRTDKVSKLARQVLGEAIDSLKDPRVGFATITSVRVSADLRHAVVLVSVMGNKEEQANTMKGLESAKPYLRGELGRQVRMKYTPELHFHQDHGPEQAQRLEEIFRELHRNDTGETPE
jgi:ribosome-binding factor A